MVDLTKSSQNILAKKLEEYIQKGKNQFYLRDIVEETKISMVEVEDFVIPLLKQNELEGKLEVRCPNCSAELGIYKNYHELPPELECEFCGTTFPTSSEYMEIILEVTGKFFRASLSSTSANQKSIEQNRIKRIAKRCY